jgi:hypothetical protein
VAHGPIAAVRADHDGDPAELPDGVYDIGVAYPLERFTLNSPRQRLAELCKLLDTEPERVEVRFGGEKADQAETLGAPPELGGIRRTYRGPGGG